MTHLGHAESPVSLNHQHMAFTRRVAAAAAGALAFSTLTVVLAAPAQAAPPANDDLADAQALPATGDVESTTEGATVESGEADVAEADVAQFGCPVDHSVWFSYTATTNDVLRLTTRSTDSGPIDIDTVLSVYTSSSPTAPTMGSLSPVLCNEKYGLSSKSRLEFRLAAGTTYFVQVSTLGNDETGVLPEVPFVLRLESAPGPPNDDFANAIPLVAGTVAQTTTDFSTQETGEPQGPDPFCDGVYDSVWFTFTAPEDGVADLVVDNAFNLATVATAYASPSGTMDDLTFLDCGTFSPPYEANAGFAVTAGETYWIRVGDRGHVLFRGFQGDRTVLVTLGPAVPGDDLADAVPTTVPASYAIDATFASTEHTELFGPIGCFGSSQRTRWFSYTPDVTGDVKVQALNGGTTGEGPRVNVYSGSPAYPQLQPVHCGFENTSFTFHVVAGTTYYIQAGTREVKATYDLALSAGTTTSLSATSAAPSQATLVAGVTTVSGTLDGSVEFSEVVDGSATPVGSRAVVSGQAVLELTNLSAGPHLYRATYTSATPGHLASTSTDQLVTVAAPIVTKAASATTVTAPAKVRRGKAPTITISVLRGTAPATGQITVLLKKKVLGTFTLVSCGLSRCPLKVKLPKLTKKTKITVTYAGNDTTLASTAKATIRIKKT
jgi:hypothetical protein